MCERLQRRGWAEGSRSGSGRGNRRAGGSPQGEAGTAPLPQAAAWLQEMGGWRSGGVTRHDRSAVDRPHHASPGASCSNSSYLTLLPATGEHGDHASTTLPHTTTAAAAAAPTTATHPLRRAPVPRLRLTLPLSAAWCLAPLLHPALLVCTGWRWSLPWLIGR